MRIGWDMRKVMQNLLLWKRLMTERIIKAEDGTVIQSLERVPCRRCRFHVDACIATSQTRPPAHRAAGQGRDCQLTSVSGIRRLGVPYISHAATKATALHFTSVIVL